MLKEILFGGLLCLVISANAQEPAKPAQNTPQDIQLTFTDKPEDLITTAETSIKTAANYDKGIEAMNMLLLMPENKFSRRGLELLGLLYERMGQLEKAKIRYRQYLNKYPDTDSTQRVKERLITLEISDPEIQVNRLVAKTPAVGHSVKINSSVSAFVFVGASTSNNKTMLNQEALITSVRSSGTFKNDEFTTKYQLRFNNIHNFLNNQPDKVVISSAYVSVQDTFLDRGLKVGRQTSNLGPLGRFDGLVANYGLGNGTSLHFLTGIPWMGDNNPTHRFFYGGAVTIRPLSDFSSEAYYNVQYADHLKERAAVGGTLRWQKPGGAAVSATSEYDVLYRKLNSFTLQANVPIGKYSIYTLYDERESPVLFADRGLLIGLDTNNKQAYNSVGDLVNNSHMSTDQIYNFINKNTSIIRTYVIGVNRPLGERWTIAADVQATGMTGTQDPTFVPTPESKVSQLVQNGTGNAYTVDMSLLGENVLKKGNSMSGLISSSHDATTSTFALTGVIGQKFGDQRIDLMIKALKHHQLAIQSDVILSTLRYNRHISDSFALDAEVSLSRTLTVDSILNQSLITYDELVYFGLVYEF